MTITGTTGDDIRNGTSGKDVFNMSQGGHDTVDGKGGADVFKFGDTFESLDVVEGGAGRDKLILDGDYSASLSIVSTMMHSVEVLSFVAGNDYSFRLFDDVVGSGKTLTIDGSNLAVADILTIDAGFMTAASADTTLVVKAGAGTLFFTAGAGANRFVGGSNFSSVIFGDNFDKHDRLDGGTAGGSNSLHLVGDYSAGLTITSKMLKNFDEIRMDDGFSYKLKLGDGVVAAGKSMEVNSSVTTGHSFTFNGSAETDGGYRISLNSGDSNITTGAQHDFVDIRSGANTVDMGDGDDQLQSGGYLNADDRLDGGAGNDEIDFNGDFSAGLVISDGMVTNFEFFYINGGFSYNFTMADAVVAAGQSLGISASSLGVVDVLTIDASAETDGTYEITGGDANDVIVGGQSGNTIAGNFGADVMTAGAGKDVFRYFTGDPDESTSTGHDIINGFDAAHDKFDIETAVGAVDGAVTSGQLRANHFDSDLAAAIDGGHLASGHAVLFTPDSGNLAGHTFLIIDRATADGYQAGADYVIELVGATHTANLDADNFI